MCRGSLIVYSLLHLERALPEGERCDVRDDDLAVCTSENWEENFCLSLVMKSRSGDEECKTQDQEPLKIATTQF